MTEVWRRDGVVTEGRTSNFEATERREGRSAGDDLTRTSARPKPSRDCCSRELLVVVFLDIVRRSSMNFFDSARSIRETGAWGAANPERGSSGSLTGSMITFLCSRSRRRKANLFTAGLGGGMKASRRLEDGGFIICCSNSGCRICRGDFLILGSNLSTALDTIWEDWFLGVI